MYFLYCGGRNLPSAHAMNNIFCSSCLGVQIKIAFIYLLDFDKGIASYGVL